VYSPRAIKPHLNIKKITKKPEALETGNTLKGQRRNLSCLFLVTGIGPGENRQKRTPAVYGAGIVFMVKQGQQIN
jgi:hypothetical protein